MKVKEKAEKAEELYNEMLLNFCDYGNRCYHDTFVKGMPQFFLYYDSLYNPQNHILTLDYPVVGNVEKLCGIDLIYQYLMCIEIENEFLAGFEEDRIREILLNYHNNYEELISNVSEIILRHILLEGIQRIEGDVYDTVRSKIINLCCPRLYYHGSFRICLETAN